MSFRIYFLQHEDMLCVLIRIASSQYTILNMKTKVTQNYPKSAAMGFFSKGPKNEFEKAVVNEPSVFEPLKFYCNSLATSVILKIAI